MLKKDVEIRAQDEATDSTNDGSDITGPYFDANIPNNVTAIVGKSAFLRCRVRNLGNKTVKYLKLCWQFEFGQAISAKNSLKKNSAKYILYHLSISWHGFVIETCTF